MDPYRPPAAVLTEPSPAGRAKRFRILPVLVGGFVVDFLGTNVASVGLGIAMGRIAIGLSSNSSYVLVEDPSLLLWSSVAVGSLFTFLGGYVAARWAGFRFLLHGAATGALSLTLSLPFVFGANETTPAWLLYGGPAITIPLAILGGWIASRRAASGRAGERSR